MISSIPGEWYDGLAFRAGKVLDILFIAIVELFPSSTKSFIFIAMSLPYLSFVSNVFLPKILIDRFERSGFFMCDISNLLRLKA